jgi:CrcB protein
MDRAQEFLLVAAGGAAGALARWLLSVWISNRSGSRFPWATLVVNLLGCLVIGFVLTFVEERLAASRVWRPLVAIGFVGAFTTFSTFSWETHGLLKDAEWLRASAYVAGSVLLGLGALRAGVELARLRA